MLYLAPSVGLWQVRPGIQRDFGGRAIGAGQGFVVEPVGSVSRQAGAPDDVVNTAQAGYSAGRILFQFARNVGRAIEAQ